MTAEIELLPLPEGEASSFGNYEVHDNEAMIEYARANVARNTALLRAEIEAMERQEPVAWLHETRRDSDVVTDAVKHVWGKVAVGSMAAYSIPLYTLPGAKGE